MAKELVGQAENELQRSHLDNCAEDAVARSESLVVQMFYTERVFLLLAAFAVLTSGGQRFFVWFLLRASPSDL